MGSLKTIHMLFIVLSMAICLFFGIWAVGQSDYMNLLIASVMFVGLAIYLDRFARTAKAL